tara:strand:- start:397 stop:600 length:204 start_codon:yes stop_codon:yes gene_type:complete
MKYKVIQHLTYRNSVVVEADNKEEAWSKAIEGGYMNNFGECIDVKVVKTTINNKEFVPDFEEIKDER